MSYKNFQVCKEIYLPINSTDDLTLDEYKAKYGIDLKPFIHLKEDTKYIHFFVPNAKLFIVFLSSNLENSLLNSQIFPITSVHSMQNWDEGADDALTNIGVEDYHGDTYCMQLYIPNDKDFSIENLKISSTY